MRTVLASVAHSKASPGAQNGDWYVSEYDVSQRATIAFWQTLGGEHPVELYDAGPLTVREYDDAKIECVNACMPVLAIEMHLNASTNKKAKYGEVLYHAGSAIGKDAAEAVMASLARNFKSQGLDWTPRGARPSSIEQDGHGLFFLERTKCAAIIVEGLFVSNDAHAKWLVDNQMGRLYGCYVAEGIKSWLKL